MLLALGVLGGCFTLCCYALIAPMLQQETSAASAKALSKQSVKVVCNSTYTVSCYDMV